MVNQLQHNIVWGQRGNFLEVPTDCPQRDERLGWMGDAQIFVRTACYNMDVAAFFTKWMRDVDDAQRPDGAFTDVSPRVAAGAGTAAWGDAGVIVPWTIYQVYGDTRIIDAALRRDDAVDRLPPAAQHRPAPSRGRLRRLALDRRRHADGRSRHRLLRLQHRAAGEDGARPSARTRMRGRYEALFGRIRDAFNRAYVAPDGRIKGDTQTCYVLALQFDLLPPKTAGRRGPLPGRGHPAPRTGTSPPASSAPAICCRC